jgi:hypothetical protein
MGDKIGRIGTLIGDFLSLPLVELPFLKTIYMYLLGMAIMDMIDLGLMLIITL